MNSKKLITLENFNLPNFKMTENTPIKFIFDVGMVIGPAIGYGYQYILIRRRKSIGTFSIDICGILLFANITRLNFYLFKKY